MQHQTPPTSSSRTPSRERLPYFPALDGLRGLAVAAVLLYHQGFTWAKGGFLGVSLFFTLSGFLITGLALVEHRTTGTVSLKGFWERRVRRIVPASLLALTLALIVTVVAVPEGQQMDAVGDIRAALFNVANWRFIWNGTPYLDLFTVPSPVQHYWSLAIEEQFYLVFPIVAMLCLRKRGALAAVLGAVVVVSFGLQVAIHGADRIYYGTDTRAAELAIGGLLACALPTIRKWSTLHRRALVDSAGALALAGAFVLWSRLPLTSGALYNGGLVAIALLWAVLLLCTVEGRGLGAALSWTPLVALGKISYGVYLFHFPLYLWLSADRVNLHGAPLFAVRAVATVALATLSYRLIEMPVRQKRVLRPRPSLAALVPVAAVLAIVPLAVVTTSGGSTAAAIPRAGSPDSPPRIVVVGDSTAHANGNGLQLWGERTGRLEVVGNVYRQGCPIVDAVEGLLREGMITHPDDCDGFFPDVRAVVDETDPDAVVVFIGSPQLEDWRLKGESEFRHLTQPDFDALLEDALPGYLDELEDLDVPILWADLPLPALDMHVFEQELNTVLPGTGEPFINDAARTDKFNELVAAELPNHPRIAAFAYKDNLESPDGTVDPALRPDGLHLSPDGVAQIADAWLFDALQAAFRDVTANADADLPAPRLSVWSATSS